MKTVKYECKTDVPVIADVDVLVVGAGPGGFCAAVTAARQGRSVAIAEHYGSPGGMANAGEVSPFMINHCGDDSLDKPLYGEWVNRMRAYRSEGFAPEVIGRNKELVISRYEAMLAIEDMLLESGVKPFYHHTFFDVIQENGKISAVIFSGKSGLSAIRAKMVVDSTGDGDVAAKAGCDYEFGNEDGFCQPMTLCFKLSHVDKSRVPSRKEITELYHKAKAEGRIDCPREDVLFFSYFDADVVHFNTTRVIKHNATDTQALSDAEIVARKQLREYLAFFRASVPGYENADIHSVATQIGIRESRRILGLEYLTVDAFDRQARFEDAISRVNYPVDIHNPSGSGTVIRHLKADEFYEIPYGCIVPPAVKNLLVGCRAISVDHALHSSMRVMPPVCSIGQAAGMAAALSVARNCSPAELEGVQVRKALREFGANL